MRMHRGVWRGLALAASCVMVGCGGDDGSSSGMTAPTGLPVANLLGGESPPLGEQTPVEYPLVPANPEQVVVEVESEAIVDALVLAYGLEVASVSPSADGFLVLFDNPDEAALEEIADTPGVDGADPNVEAILGTSQTLILGHLEGEWDPESSAAQTWIEDLALAEVHATSTGAGATIAILDTGAASGHPHLLGKTVELPPDTRLESEEYKDHADEDEDGLVDECFGHGTHVAGCIATVAPGASLVPIKVMSDDGYGSLWDILRGLDLARQMDVDVINLSFSLSAEHELIEQSLAKCAQEGIVVVAAAGNAGSRHPKYPATSAYAYGVAAIDENGHLSSFSGAGASIDLAAPGETILSAYPRTEAALATGTSMATPIAAGCIALVMEALGRPAQDAVGKLCLHAVPITPVIAVQHGRVAPLDTITMGD